MAINNLNPRRTVWFSPHEPSNKYDIWLSKNAHLDENGEPTTDSNAQRDCDYIFKIYDCGKWNPIVGFNSTAKYKIDTVKDIEYSFEHNGTSLTKTGFRQFDLPLFRHPDDSPAELFSFGTLGESINEFVTEAEWINIFNNPNFYNSFNSEVIGGDNYNWSTLINTLISNGDVLIPFADEDTCGGIYSATHTYDALNAFKPIEVKFYPTTSAYSSKLHRLCVSASDVILQINSYYNDNPSGQSLSIPLATTSTIGGIKSDVHSYGVTSAFKPVECKFYPNQGTWSSLYERLCINANDVIDLFIASFDNEYPLLIGGNGITLGLTLDHSQITWEVSNLRYASDGKYARSKITGTGDHTIEWVDGTQNIQTNENISCDNKDIEIAGNIIYEIDVNNGDERQDEIATLDYWNYYSVSDFKSLKISDTPNSGNPIYIKLNINGFAPSDINISASVTEFVDVNLCLTAIGTVSRILFTRQFGIDKFELLIWS